MNKGYKEICMYSLKNTHTYKLTNQSKENINIYLRSSYIFLPNCICLPVSQRYPDFYGKYLFGSH